MIPVQFTAVREGTSKNNIKYTANELKKSHGSMADKPILKDHDAKCDNVVGRTNITMYNDTNKSITGEGFIDDTLMEEKIKKGLIKEVSIGAIVDQLVKESDESDIMEARGITFQELSLVPIAGVCGTSISQSESVKTNLKEGGMGLLSGDASDILDGIVLANKDKTPQQILQIVKADSFMRDEMKEMEISDSEMISYINDVRNMYEKAKVNVKEVLSDDQANKKWTNMSTDDKVDWLGNLGFPESMAGRGWTSLPDMVKVEFKATEKFKQEENKMNLIKEEVPAPAAPAPAPAQQDPVQMIMAKLEQIVQMLGPKAEEPKEAPATESAKPKGKVSESTETKESVQKLGNKTIYVDEKGKKFCKEYTRNGVSMYYI
jgi:hypothetical protein